jgi:hypothetical protein
MNMQIVEIHYRKLFNLGDYQNEAIELFALLNPDDDLKSAYEALRLAVHKLHGDPERESRLNQLEEALENARSQRTATDERMKELEIKIIKLKEEDNYDANQ